LSSQHEEEQNHRLMSAVYCSNQLAYTLV